MDGTNLQSSILSGDWQLRRPFRAHYAANNWLEPIDNSTLVHVNQVVEARIEFQIRFLGQSSRCVLVFCLPRTVERIVTSAANAWTIGCSPTCTESTDGANRVSAFRREKWQRVREWKIWSLMEMDWIRTTDPLSLSLSLSRPVRAGRLTFLRWCAPFNSWKKTQSRVIN